MTIWMLPLLGLDFFLTLPDWLSYVLFVVALSSIVYGVWTRRGAKSKSLLFGVIVLGFTVVTLNGTYSSAWVHTGDYVKQAFKDRGVSQASVEEPDLLVAVYSGDTFQAKVGVFESVQIRVEPLGDDKYALWGQVDGSNVGWMPLKDLGSMGSAEELSQLGDDETTPTEPESISPNPNPHSFV